MTELICTCPNCGKELDLNKKVDTKEVDRGRVIAVDPTCNNCGEVFSVLANIKDRS